jgi:hypothetical protein
MGYYEHVSEFAMEDVQGNFSFLNPRDPSLCLGNRPFEIKRLNLLSRFGDETEHSRISKNERVKVYLRIKPTQKDPTLMFALPQVTEDMFEDYITYTTDVRHMT